MGYVQVNEGDYIVCKKCEDIQYGLCYNRNTQQCNEKCGDGINIGIAECDDGNTIDHDGCSS